jgi:LemA protein
LKKNGEVNMITLIVILIIAILFALYLIFGYNSLVRLKKMVQNSWSQIDVQLKRRHDLIPNLVNSVKGYMNYEKDTLEKVMQARNKALNAGSIGEKIESEKNLTGVLGRLFAVMENYPDLKANQNVQSLMKELSETENKISYSRQFYNDIVTKYNTKIEVFPTNMIAGMFHFKEFELFKIENEEKSVPEVKF